MIEILHRRCAGLDVHQREVAACVRLVSDEGKVIAHTRRFETTPSGLAALREWLTSHGVTHVAMEGTGVYWMPVYEALRSGFDLTLCNAHHVKKVPGRKTDQSDAAWLAQLLSQGLLNKSYVPTREIRDLRELTRARVHRVEDRARIVNTVHRLLERAGLKLCSVISDLQGLTGRAILTDIAAGVTDAEALAAHARGSLRKKRAALVEVLRVQLTPIERLLLGQQLTALKHEDQTITVLDAEITKIVANYPKPMALLCGVPGIEFVAAAAILAEIGPDMSVFRGPDGIASWTGVAPGQCESAGKRKRSQTRRGNAYLSRILVQCAIAIGRTTKKQHDLSDFFRKKLPKLGFKKTAVATARKLIVRIWRILTDGVAYAPPPPRPLSDKLRARRAKQNVARLEELGFKVTIERVAA